MVANISNVHALQHYISVLMLRLNTQNLKCNHHCSDPIIGVSRSWSPLHPLISSYLSPLIFSSLAQKLYAKTLFIPFT